MNLFAGGGVYEYVCRGETIMNIFAMGEAMDMFV